MQTTRKGKMSAYYSLKANNELKHFNRIQKNVNIFYHENNKSNTDLLMFKNLLGNKVRANLDAINTMSMQAISNQYLPFIFNIQVLPKPLIFAIASSNLQLSGTDIEGLGNAPLSLLKHQAYNGILYSLTYGPSILALTMQNLTENKKFIQKAYQAYENVTKSLSNAADKIVNTVSSGAKYIGSGFNKLAGWIGMGKDTTQQKLNEMQKKIQQALEQKDDVLQMTQADLVAIYLANLKLYGKIIIDFYFLKNFSIPTIAFGRTVYYIPTIDSLLFQLNQGKAYVYLKTNNQIQIISESMFDQKFVIQLAKTVAARRNAEVINQFNSNVKDIKFGETRRDVFKQKISNNYWLHRENYVIEQMKNATQKQKEKFIADKLAQERKDQLTKTAPQTGQLAETKTI